MKTSYAGLAGLCIVALSLAAIPAMAQDFYYNSAPPSGRAGEGNSLPDGCNGLNDVKMAPALQEETLGLQLPVSTCATVTCASIGTDSPNWPSVHGTLPYRMFRDGVPSVCSPSKTCPGPYSSGTFHYDAYQFLNSGSSPACVTVMFTTNCGTDVFAAAYQGTFSPTDICAGYLGDIGSSTSQPFSFMVPGGACFSVIVTDVWETGCQGGYSFSISGIACGSCSPYDMSFSDDFGRSIVCVDSKTGAWQYNVLSGLWKGVYTGKGSVSKTADRWTFRSLAGSPRLMLLTYYPQMFRATASLGGSDFVSQLSDRNTKDSHAVCAAN